MERIRVHHLHAGMVRVSPALPFGNGNFLKASGLITPVKDKIWLPISAVYIEHPKARILVDTGWNRAISPNGVLDRKAEIAHLNQASYIASAGYVASGNSVAEQLAAMGMAPSDLDYIVLSHLDTDHVSGLGSLTEAKRILVSADEMTAARKWFPAHTRYVAKLWNKTPIEMFEYDKTGLGPVGESFDLLGDGSVRLVHIPGHSKGLCATLLSANGRTILYFSDGGYATRSWKEMILPGICEDKKAARKSLDWIRTVSSDSSCIDSFACHDPDITPHLTIL